MTEENDAKVPEDESGLGAVDGITGDEIDLAWDPAPDPEDSEPSEESTGEEAELTQEGDEAVETEEQDPGAEPTSPETPVTEEAQPQETNFLEYEDHKFGDAEQVTQYLKTVEGRQRVAQVAHRDALSKNDAWIEWGNNPQKLRERIAELEGTQPEAVKVSQEKVTALDSIDWQNLETLVKEGKGMQALATMADNFDKTLESRIAQEIGKVTESVAPMTEQAAAREATVSLMQSAEASVDSNGDPAWPELTKASDQFDPQFCQLFAQQWEALPANIAWDDGFAGVEIAYNRTKAMMPRGTPATEAPTAPAATPAADMARDAAGRFVKNTEAAATSVGGSDGQPLPSSQPTESYQEAAILKSMDDVGKDTDPVFGIRR